MGLRHHWYRRAGRVRSRVGGGHAAGVGESVVRADVQAIIAASRRRGEFVWKVLERQLDVK
jgi:hypothetical protein